MYYVKKWCNKKATQNSKRYLIIRKGNTCGRINDYVHTSSKDQMTSVLQITMK